MNYKIFDKNSTEEVASLFTSVSWPPPEGEQGRRTDWKPCRGTGFKADNQERICIGVFEEETIIGVICLHSSDSELGQDDLAMLDILTQHHHTDRGRAPR